MLGSAAQMGALAFVVCNALALAAAWGLARVLLPGGDRLQRVVATAAGFLSLVIGTAIVLGNLGLFTPLPMCCALLLEAAALHGYASWRKLPGPAAPDATPMSVPAAAVTGAVAGLIALQAVAFVDWQMLTAWHPHWDDLSYHAPMPAHWLQAGRLVLAPYHYHAYYPGNGELLAAWFMLATKLDGNAALAGLFSMLLCALAAVLLCRRLGCDWASSLLSVVVLLLCKPFWQHSGTFVAVDLTATAALVAALALAVPGSVGADALRGRACLTGALLGVAIGCKVTFAPLAPLVAAYLVLEHRPKLRETGIAAALFAGAALLCGSFYYIRNWVLTQNPLFPAAVLGFEGPLDPGARAPTSLLYQLRFVTPERLATAWTELLNWPAPVAYLLIAAYAASLLAALHWPQLKQPIARARLLLLLAGLLALYVTAAAPFSGTANAKFARLQIRLRFFLPSVMIAIPLAAYWLRWLGRGGPWLPALALVAAGYLWSDPWPRVVWFVVVGAAIGVGLRFLRLPAVARVWAVRAAAVAALVLLPSAAAWSVHYKQIQNDLYIERVIPAWNLLKYVPDGKRMTWFATFEGYKYYRAFGRGLRLTPVPVDSNGRRILFLHEYWREEIPTWWSQGQVVETDPDTHQLVSNLRKKRIEYVLVMKRHASDQWPVVRDVLLHAPGVAAIQKRKSATLFKVEPARKKQQ